MLQDRKIESGVSIYDYSNTLLGGFDNLITLLTHNPKFININVNLSDFTTQDIIWDDDDYESKAPQVELSNINAPSTIGFITGLSQQNLYDVNLKVYSGFDSLVKFLVDNSVNSINDHDVAFKVFKFDSTANNNLSLKAAIDKRGYVFATKKVFNGKGFLLQESGYLLLQENGFKIIIT